MTARTFVPTLLLAASCLAAGVAGATSFEDAALSRLDAEGFAALSRAPEGHLALLRRASDVFAARRAGLLPEEHADVLAAGPVFELAAGLPALAQADSAVVAATLAVEYAVLEPELRAALAGADPTVQTPLGLAALAWTEGLKELARQRTMGDEGLPDMNCFQEYAKCVQACAELENWFDRSLCGLDCAAALVHCLISGLPPGGSPRGEEPRRHVKQ